jgi:hypothetical protein
MAQQRMAAFEALPALDVAARHRTTEGDRRLAALRAAGPLCQVQPIGALGRLRWADCNRAFGALAFDTERQANPLCS